MKLLLLVDPELATLLLAALGYQGRPFLHLLRLPHGLLTRLHSLLHRLLPFPFPYPCMLLHLLLLWLFLRHTRVYAHERTQERLDT